MKRLHACALAASIAFGFAASCTYADPPEWAGKGKGKGGEWHEKGKGHGKGHDSGRHFSERQRVLVHEYYGDAFRSGRCPPGLAKKNNGCMPPGQAKKWRIGRPLPREVVYYSLPQELVVRLGPPPSGHEYVRVAGDILLITVGTAMVVDALRDLGGR